MEPLEKNALERLESYEKELRENLKQLAPVERDEAIREVRAHVLGAVEAGREAGKSDQEVTDEVLKGFGNPSEYAAEYIATTNSETPRLGILDRGILFLVKGAAKLWAAFLIGLVYFGFFTFIFFMSLGGMFGGLATIAFHAHLFPQFFGNHINDIGLSSYAGLLLITMGICGLYLTIRLLIKVIRFHYYYRSSPKRLFTYLKERKGSGFWTLWRIIDIAAVATIMLSFAVGFFTQSTVMPQVEAKSVMSVTKESVVEKRAASVADLTLKLFGTAILSAQTASDTVANTDLARFISTYNYDVLRPVLQVTRSGSAATILYVPRGTGNKPGANMQVHGLEANLNGNKHSVFLSPNVTWDLSLQLIGQDADINLAEFTMKKLDLDFISGDNKTIRFSKPDTGTSKAASFTSASIENMHGSTNIDFTGVRNMKPSTLSIRNYSSPLMVRGLGDANPASFEFASYAGNDVTLYFDGHWSNGAKSITIEMNGGNLDVLIPRDMQARLSVINHGGKTNLFDISSEGIVGYKTPGFESSPTKLEIKVTSRAGNVRVDYAK